MVSGILLIPKEETIKTIIKKRVLKYVAIIIGFSFIQYLFHIIRGSIDFSVDSIITYATKLYADSVIIPYWFLYAYLSLLILLPFIRKLIKNMTSVEFKYLIVLHLIFFSACQIFEYFTNTDRINLSLPLACETSYFYCILGYYIDNNIKIKKQTRYLHIISFISVILSTLMVYWQISKEEIFTSGADFKFTSALIIFPTVSIFLLCKKHCTFSNKALRFIVSLTGSATFGIYLIEEILEQTTFDVYFIAKKFLPPVISWFLWIFFIVIFATVVISIYKSAINLTQNAYKKLTQHKKQKFNVKLKK